MNRTLQLTTLASLALCSGVARMAAQTCTAYAPDNTIVWPNGFEYGNPLAFGRAIVAQLDDDEDREPDAVVLAGGTACVLWTVGSYSAVQPIDFSEQDPPADPPDAVADIAAYPGGGPNGTDAVWMTDDRGLFLVTHGTNGFEATVVSSSWVNAAPLHVVDIDGDGDLDVLALSANKRTILRCIKTPTGFTFGIPITKTFDMWDVASMNWNGGGPRELVVVSANGLNFYTSTGSQAFSPIGYSSTTGCIAPLVEGGIEYLAWSRDASGGGSELLVVNSAGASATIPLNSIGCDAAAIDPIALVVGDLDGTADDDLLIVHEGNRTALLLSYITGTFFDPDDASGRAVVLDLSSSPENPGAVGIPALAQIDGVLSQDIVFPLSTEASVAVWKKPFFDFAYPANQGYYDGSSFASARSELKPPCSGTCDGDLSDTHPTLRFAFGIPPDYQDYTHIRVALWYRPDESSDLDTDAVSYMRHPLLSYQQGVGQWISFDRPGGTELDAPSYDSTGGICWSAATKPYYYAEYRFEKLNGSGQVLSHSPNFFGGFTLQDCEGTSDYSPLTGFSGAIEFSDFVLRLNNGLSGGGGGSDPNSLGLYISMSALPPFSNGANGSKGGPPATGGTAQYVPQ